MFITSKITLYRILAKSYFFLINLEHITNQVVLNKILLCILLLSLSLSNRTFAHGDLDERIVKVTEEIKQSQDSAYLYFKRGKLYFQHEEYTKSIQDLKESSKLGFQSTEQNLLFSKNYFRTERYTKALLFVDLIINEHPKSVLALKLKAQINLKLSNFRTAAEGFENVINYTSQAFPENYIDASVAWESLNNDEGYEKAASIVKKGITNLGELVSLQQRLIAIQLIQDDILSAIETQKRILELSHRKERAYYELSKLYMLNKENKLALESLNLAKLHFEDLPLRIQNTSFMKQLLDDIKSTETILQPNN